MKIYSIISKILGTIGTDSGIDEGRVSRVAGQHQERRKYPGLVSLFKGKICEKNNMNHMMRYTNGPIRNLQIICVEPKDWDHDESKNTRYPGPAANFSLLIEKRPLRDCLGGDNRRSCCLHPDSVTPTDAGASFGSGDVRSPRGGVAEGSTQNMHLVHSSFPDQMWGTKKEYYEISRGSNPCLNTFPNSLAIFGSSAHIGQV